MKNTFLGLLLIALPMSCAYADPNTTAQPAKTVVQAPKPSVSIKTEQEQPKRIVKKTVRRVAKTQPTPTQEKIVEHHIYHHHYDKPKRVVVRRVPKRAPVRTYTEERHYISPTTVIVQPAPRRHHHYTAPRVIHHYPANSGLSFNYRIG